LGDLRRRGGVVAVAVGDDRELGRGENRIDLEWWEGEGTVGGTGRWGSSDLVGRRRVPWLEDR